MLAQVYLALVKRCKASRSHVAVSWGVRDANSAPVGQPGAQKILSEGWLASPSLQSLIRTVVESVTRDLLTTTSSTSHCQSRGSVRSLV